MAGAIMNKVWDLFGMDTERDAEEVEEKHMITMITIHMMDMMKKKMMK